MTIVKTCCSYSPTGFIAIYYFCLWSFSQFQIHVTLFSSKTIIINLQVKVHDPLFQMLHWSPNTWRLFHPLHPISFVTLSKRLYHGLAWFVHYRPCCNGSKFHCLLTAYRLSFNIFSLTLLHIDLLLCCT